ncbi:MAG: hypothetical protein JSS66_01830 [Armatimonadetes bacterium]|nr:hypothetical protein [Armatimonadota bacterium]
MTSIRSARFRSWLSLVLGTAPLVALAVASCQYFLVSQDCYVTRYNSVIDDSGSPSWSDRCRPNDSCQIQVDERIENRNLMPSATTQIIRFGVDEYEFFPNTRAELKWDLPSDTLFELPYGKVRVRTNWSQSELTRIRRIRAKGTVTSAGAYGGGMLLINGSKEPLNDEECEISIVPSFVVVTAIKGTTTVNYNNKDYDIAQGTSKNFPY